MTEGEPGLDIRILGALQVVLEGTPVEVAGRQQQAILFMLVLNRGRAVRASRLVDALWGPTPPPSAAASLRVSVSKLRRVLRSAPPSQVLLTASGGYVLDVCAEQTDVGRFEQALAAAHAAGGPRERSQHLDRALRMWRGPPGPVPEYDADVSSELARLVELRDLALEDRAEAALQLGRHRELVPELEALVAQAPLRERRTGLLMLALDRSGRQADALAAFRVLRSRLVEELGLEPSAELQAARAGGPRRRDRRHVPRPGVATGALDPGSYPQPVGPEGRSCGGRRRAHGRGGRGRRDDGRGLALGRRQVGHAGHADRLGTTESGNGRRDGGTPGAHQDPSRDGLRLRGAGRAALWVHNDLDETASRVDLDSGLVTNTVPVGAGGGDLTLAGGDLWVSNPGDNTVTRVDGRSGAAVATIPVGLAPQGITSADGDVWVAIHRGERGGSVWRIDVETNEVVARIPVGARQFRAGPSWLASGAGSLWVGVPNLSAVVRIDPRTGTVTATIPIRDGGVCGRLSVDDDAVWVASGLCGDGALTRIDPATNQVVARITSPRWNSVFTQTTGPGSVWLATDGGPFEVDPATDEVVGRLALAGDLSFGGDLAVGQGSLWIHDAKNQSLLRLQLPASLRLPQPQTSARDGSARIAATSAR